VHDVVWKSCENVSPGTTGSSTSLKSAPSSDHSRSGQSFKCMPFANDFATSVQTLLVLRSHKSNNAQARLPLVHCTINGLGKSFNAPMAAVACSRVGKGLGPGKCRRTT